MQIGLFEDALRELVNGGLEVEATFLAVVLSEMGLIKTKMTHEATVAATTSQQKRIIDEYSDSELEQLAESVIDVDGWAERLVASVSGSQYATEANCMLSLISDPEIKSKALAQFAVTHNLDVSSTHLKLSDGSKHLRDFLGKALHTKVIQ